MRRRLLLLAVFLMPTSAYAQREVTPEARLFREYRDGVFTVFGDGSHGSGFLVSGAGLVLTNQHVIASSRYVRVQIDDSVKVAADVIAVDSARDVAVLRINPSVVEGLPVLEIASRRGELAFEGERVIAIGSPLHQTKILTSGIVSKVEGSAIISDVNINPGNSGGPLLNMDGEMVAINTFGDPSPTVGPGVSGSISIYLALPMLEAAGRKLASSDPPPPDRLPVMPRDIFPLKALEATAAAAWWDEGAYHVSKLAADSLVALFGQPDTVYELTFGAKTDRPWDGVAYRYYAAKDPLYRHADEWKKNTFYFYRSPRGLVLNHRVVEHAMNGETK